MSHGLLKEHIGKHLALPAGQLEEISSLFSKRFVGKGGYLLRQGSVCRFEGFVTAGCFRTFTIDHRGIENILYFAAEDWWLIDTDSFLNGTPSELNFQALEDSEVLVITAADKERLYERLPVVERLFRIMAQKALAAWQRRLVRNHSLKATERYRHFMDTYPGIASRLTDRQIAAYLGITHEFLSRIKSRETI